MAAPGEREPCQGGAVRARGDHQQHRRADDRARDGLQQVAGQRVQPVRVLDDHDDATGLLGDRTEQPAEQVLQRRLAELPVERRGQLVVGDLEPEQRPEEWQARGQAGPLERAGGATSGGTGVEPRSPRQIARQTT